MRMEGQVSHCGDTDVIPSTSVDTLRYRFSAVTRYVKHLEDHTWVDLRGPHALLKEQAEAMGIDAITKHLNDDAVVAECQRLKASSDLAGRWTLSGGSRQYVIEGTVAIDAAHALADFQSTSRARTTSGASQTNLAAIQRMPGQNTNASIGSRSAGIQGRHSHSRSYSKGYFKGDRYRRVVP